MDQTTHQDIAGALHTARLTGVAVDQPSVAHPGMTLEDAYAVQELLTRRRVADGAVVKGHKVGLTSVVMQRQLGVDQPDYGVLFDDMFFLEHSAVPAGGLIAPRVEPEIAFVLKASLAGPGVTAADAIRAVDFVLPSLEIIDSRVKDWRIAITDTIADNASSAGVVLGSHPTRLDEVDLRLVGCTLRVDAEVVATGAGGAVLGSPLNALVWLANTLGAHGVALEAGHVILPGSVTAAQAVTPGSTVSADFGVLGSVTARFAASDGSGQEARA